MINKFERIWKDVVVAYPRYYPGICLGVLRKIGGIAVRITGF
jgi:hypothetical protein